MIDDACGKKLRPDYSERTRIGDPGCHFSDLSKFRSHYPQWQVNYSLEQIITEKLAAAERD